MSLDEKHASARSVERQLPIATMLPYTRREFAKLTALSGAGLLSALNRLGAAETGATPGKPNSKVAGVQLGLNVPYSFADSSMSGDDILRSEEHTSELQ